MWSFSLSDAEFDRDGKERRRFGRSGIMPNREMGGNQIFTEGQNPEGFNNRIEIRDVPGRGRNHDDRRRGGIGDIAEVGFRDRLYFRIPADLRLKPGLGAVDLGGLRDVVGDDGFPRLSGTRISILLPHKLDFKGLAGHSLKILPSTNVIR
jgi:hypothetical protein